MVQIHYYILDSIFRQILGHITDQRFAENRQRRLGPIAGQRPQPLPVSCCQNHRFHRPYILADVFGGLTLTVASEERDGLKLIIQTLMVALPKDDYFMAL